MTAESFRADDEGATGVPSGPRGLLDILGVAAVLLDVNGRIALWSPHAEELFGYSAAEALGQYAAPLLVDEEHLDEVVQLFARVLTSGESWAGTFPIRHKNGDTRLVEFRNMRLQDDLGDWYALGIAADHSTVSRVEANLALSEQLVAQSPTGLALLDTELRYALVNPTIARMNGVPAEEHVGRRIHEVLPHLDPAPVEKLLREVLRTGTPIVDMYMAVETPATPHEERTYSVSFNRLVGPHGRILGVACSVVDVTERHRASKEAERSRRRLALIADASARVGTTLEVERTARELVDVTVPELADVAAVDVLDSVLSLRRPGAPDRGPELFRALAIKTEGPSEAAEAADPTGRPAMYGEDRLVTECVHTGRPVSVPHVGPEDLLRIARNPEAAEHLRRAGVHSYLAVPLIARGEVLGALTLARTNDPLPFDEDDVLLAGELAARAAVSIDNARWYQSVRNSAVTLQRSLLPGQPAHAPGLEVAARYVPAHASSEVGGDWYDVIPLSGDKTALVVGDVMGSGIDAAATMGRLRTATCAFADLDLDPAEVLRHLDRITEGLEHYIATCLYAVYDPRRGECRMANAGHLPPVLVHAGPRPAELVDLPSGVPLGVGGVSFETTRVPFGVGDRLVLYTDGLVETRHDPLDERLAALVALLEVNGRSLEETCDRLLDAMRNPGDPDDVALLVARSRPPGGGAG
ncbi:SpoIIE family protein phosphatase [Streptomyces solicathayae]|uniref:SpoIIE family protein phosphatase n=1 Tax=Streptomyces solicathayae TaxID=3081768 RepID=A0ABZ0M3L0_9ACTN|nr:SpoIIE family protein phosphatase [Streptomyces sp. HUAS YS2]WOX26284.1 SpoIIE family protein phosphatase [Streptomyces sp. HUAS YS2]